MSKEKRMFNTILHIGTGKAGSSALQTALSKTPKLSSGNYGNVRYISIEKDGKVLHGARLKRLANATPYGYLSSCMFAELQNLIHRKESIRRALRNITKDGTDTLILSQEGWARQGAEIGRIDPFTKFDMRVIQVIAYIRNPVEWINSAWWQWGAWEYPLDKYIEQMIALINRDYECFKNWSSYAGRDRFRLKPLPKDIIGDVAHFLRTDEIKKDIKTNVSLPAEILLFFYKHRELRSKAHDPSLDFIISKYFRFDDPSHYSATPWVLSKENIKLIIDKTKESNQRLAEFMDKETAEEFLSDQRWWNEETFLQKRRENIDKAKLSYETLERILVDSLKAIKKLGNENWKLKREILD